MKKLLVVLMLIGSNALANTDQAQYWEGLFTGNISWQGPNATYTDNSGNPYSTFMFWWVGGVAGATVNAGLLNANGGYNGIVFTANTDSSGFFDVTRTVVQPTLGGLRNNANGSICNVSNIIVSTYNSVSHARVGFDPAGRWAYTLIASLSGTATYGSGCASSGNGAFTATMTFNSGPFANVQAALNDEFMRHYYGQETFVCNAEFYNQEQTNVCYNNTPRAVILKQTTDPNWVYYPTGLPQGGLIYIHPTALGNGTAYLLPTDNGWFVYSFPFGQGGYLCQPNTFDGSTATPPVTITLNNTYGIWKFVTTLTGPLKYTGSLGPGCGAHNSIMDPAATMVINSNVY